MEWSDREKKVHKEIIAWEQNLYDYMPTDIERTIEKWLEISFEKLDPRIKEQFFQSLDHWLFHLHAFIQDSDVQLAAKERLLKSARVLDEELEQINDMKKLTIDQLAFFAEQEIAKHRMYSFVQGGLAGTGGALLGIDIPSMLVINLRAVQQIATVYGYDVNIPYEMMTSLKVFHGAILPKRWRADAWSELVAEAKQQNDYYTYFYEKDDSLINESWIEQLLIQIIKSMLITLFRKKTVQGVPIVSVAIGAGMNYRLSRQITQFAHYFYQMRYLLDKQNRQ